MKRLEGAHIGSTLALIAVVLFAFAAIVSAERETSHTVDEPGHLIRGLAWWWTDDTRLSWPHPPLGQLVAAAPVAMLSDRVELETFPGWDNASFVEVTRAYFKSFSEARHQLRIARYAMGLMSLALLVYLYQWIRRRYGSRLALLTAILYAANPVLLAHAGLMTNDFPVAALTLVAVLQLHDYLLSASRGRFIGLALVVAGLVCTKHTGIVISLLLFPPAIVFVIRQRGRFLGMSRSAGFRRLARDGALAALLALFCVNLEYKFQDTWLSSSEIVAHPEPPSWLRTDLLNENDFLPDGARFPIPFNYLLGAEFIRVQNARGHAGYFMGRRTKRGFPGYFPILLGMKLPTGLIVLLAVGLGLAVRRRFTGLPLDVWLHGYVALAYLALTFDAHINIGVRHALPVVPSLVCLAGRSAEALWSRAHWGRLTAVVCIGSAVIGTIMAHPDYLADFNWLIGGRRVGHKISVVGEDWGQDTKRLARWQQQHDVPISYFTGHRMRYLEVAYWGGEVNRLRCRQAAAQGQWAAIHLTDKVRHSRCIRPYVDREPDVVINDHILLYAPTPPLVESGDRLHPGPHL